MASFDFSFQTTTLNGLNIGADMVIPSTLGDETQDGAVEERRPPINSAGEPMHTHTHMYTNSCVHTHSREITHTHVHKHVRNHVHKSTQTCLFLYPLWMYKDT